MLHSSKPSNPRNISSARATESDEIYVAAENSDSHEPLKSTNILRDGCRRLLAQPPTNCGLQLNKNVTCAFNGIMRQASIAGIV
jgi:hypothetical protein